MSTAVLSLLAYAAAVRVVAAGACPTSAEIDARLAALLPASPEGEPDEVEVVADGATLVVTLRSPTGALLGERRFEANHPCGDLAAAVAVTVAAWESDVHPAFAQKLAAPPPPPPPVVVRAPPPTPVASRPPHGFEIAFGGGGLAATSGGLGPVVDLRGGWFPRGGPAGLDVGLAYAGARSLGLEGGEARWSRFGAHVGGRVHLARPSPRTRLDVGAAFAIARLAIEGRNFLPNRDDAAWDPGAAVDVRLVAQGVRWFAYAALGVHGWFVGHRVGVGVVDERDPVLPRVDAGLRVGIGWSRGR